MFSKRKTELHSLFPVNQINNLHRKTDPTTLFHLDLQLGPHPNHTEVNRKFTNDLMGTGSGP